MKTNVYYIPVSSTSLVHYFSKALILPAKYYTHRIDDIQTNLNNYILVTTFKWVAGCDCSIEVVLTEDEVNNLHKLLKNAFGMFGAIPISRIKKIWFLNQQQAEVTVWNVNEGAGYIPKNLVNICQEATNFHKINIPEDTMKPRYEIDLTHLANKYDVILGGLAFMNCAAEKGCIYSKNYFATLSFFNNLISDQIEDASKTQSIKFDNKYHGLFSKSIKSEWTEWLEHIFKNLVVNDVEKIASKLGMHYEKRLGILQINSIDTNSHLYEIAVAAVYGENKNKTTDDLVADLINGKIRPEKAEDVALVYGLNSGYSKLYNRFKVGLRQIDVKFKLVSQLDYYTIESVYQFVFNTNKENTTFPYLDNWCPILEDTQIPKETQYYKILDTIVTVPYEKITEQKSVENYCDQLFSIWKQTFEFLIAAIDSLDETKAKVYYETKLKSVFASMPREFQANVEAISDESTYVMTTKQNAPKPIKIERQLINIEQIEPVRNIVSEDTERIYVPELHYDSGEDLSAKSIKELKAIAKRKGLKNYSNLNKEDLIKNIQNELNSQGDIFIHD